MDNSNRSPSRNQNPQGRENDMKNICIFLESGRTFTFRGVVIIVDNESVLTFDYIAMSDGNTKRVTFSKFRIVGVAQWEEQET